jgi:ribosomal protein S18 acetylase RimI-like enzyme
MEFRRASADDWAAACDIRLRALEQDPTAFCSTLERESAFDEGVWRDRLGRAATILAWDGPLPVATGTLKPDPHEAGGCEIVAMWVDPSRRGTGLADELITSLVGRAEGEGAHEVALWVAEDNDRARALYARCGFVPTGEREPMRKDVDQVRMRRELAEPLA